MPEGKIEIPIQTGSNADVTGGVSLSETLPGSSGTPSSLYFLAGRWMDSISPF
jgi:hypothetical protein